MPDPAATRHELEAEADTETDVKAMLLAGIEELQSNRGVMGRRRRPSGPKDHRSPVTSAPPCEPALTESTLRIPSVLNIPANALWMAAGRLLDAIAA